MIEQTVVYGFLISLSMGLSALAFFVWAVLSNQMDDTEDVKHRVLERELEEERAYAINDRGGKNEQV
ncbi:MAG: cbb3-type cytochrome oxidase assembly protein CcoS [Syntrophales bacterium]